ncbi:MAG: type II toxin-antitoxin system HicA family toxin [Planctomycetota bacterium]
MGRLRVLSGRQACRILAEHGFVEVRRRGSHVAMQKRGPDTSVTFSGAGPRSGLPRRLFEESQT